MDDLPDGLAHRLRRREQEIRTLMRITEQVNRGVMLEEVLDFLYREMRQLIPYDRIGLALIDREQGKVVSRWARSDNPVLLPQGYEGRLEGSTLAPIVNSGRPRIINDLQAYLAEKPHSESTRMIVDEGLRSSLTCPLIVQARPVGFVFFSSVQKETYRHAHVAFFQQIAGQLATIVEKGRLYDELAEQKVIVERQNLAMTGELEMARQVQLALIPQQAPRIPGLQIAFRYEPALQVGGDVLDIVPLGDGRALLLVADAVGHGVQAALVMSVAKAALNSAVESDPSPGSVLAAVNKVLARLFEDRFVTAACCLIDSRSRRAELSLAGHMPPLWLKAEVNQIVQEGPACLPLGVDEHAEYQTVPISLGAGDTLVFFTDGIAEAFDPAESQYGLQRLKSQVLRCGRSSVEEISAGVWRDLDAHCRGLDREDDVTMLVVRCAQTPDQAASGEPASQ